MVARLSKKYAARRKVKAIVSGLLPEEFEEVDHLAMRGCEVSAETLRGYGPR